MFSTTPLRLGVEVYEEENPGFELLFGTLVWNYLDYLYGATINLFLSKLCRKNPIRNVVGLYEMSFMVHFEFWLSWFWFGRKFSMKRAKFGHSCFQQDTPTTRRALLCLGVELRLGGGHYT